MQCLKLNSKKLSIALPVVRLHSNPLIANFYPIIISSSVFRRKKQNVFVNRDFKYQTCVFLWDLSEYPLLSFLVRSPWPLQHYMRGKGNEEINMTTV